MKRREFVEKVSVGSAAMVAGGVLAGGMDAPDAAAQEGEHHENVSGPLANATVSFGAWPIPLDRTVPPVGPPPNVHRLIPNTTTIKAGGSVNFILAGLHQVVVYGPGKRPEDVRSDLVIPMPNAPPTLPPVINDED